MLKHTKDSLYLAEAFDFLQDKFVLSKDLIVKNIPSLQNSLNKLSLDLRNELTLHINQSKNNETLSNYLMFNDKVPAKLKCIKTNHSNYDDEEETDNYDINYELPRPQPQPRLQGHNSHRFDDSKDSHRTATFIQGSEQTFAQDSKRDNKVLGQNILTDSIKKWNQSPAAKREIQTPQPQAWETFSNQSYNSSGKSFGGNIL